MAERNEIDFDFDALEAELYSGLAKAFTSLQLDFPDERFYNYHALHFARHGIRGHCRKHRS